MIDQEVGGTCRQPGVSSLSVSRLAGRVFACALVASAALTGCASLPGSQTIDVAGSRFETSEIAGAGPAIVFEAGLASYKESWGKVFQDMATTNAVFAYNRPGTGRSAATSRPRDGATIVADLRALLRNRGVKPPYVLVGHSAGGLYMQLYARLYPSEVAGLVLVDPTHPTQFEGAGALQNRSGMASAAIAAAGVLGPARTEFEALALTGLQVLAAPPLPRDIPVVILVAPDRSATSIAEFDNAKHHDFARLYPGATLREIDGGHAIQLDNPQAVSDAARSVIASAHPPRTR